MFSTVMTLVLWLLKPAIMVRSTKIIVFQLIQKAMMMKVIHTLLYLILAIASL